MVGQSPADNLENKTAEQCLNMSDLRAEIDRIDRSLVQLLSERQRYIERAAIIKVQKNQIRDEKRIADVLTKVTDAALGAGLSTTIAQSVWTVLMENSIALEMHCFEERQRAK